MRAPIFDAELVLDGGDGQTLVKPKKKKKKKLQQSTENTLGAKAEESALTAAIADTKLPEVGLKIPFNMFKDEKSFDQDPPDDGFEFSMFGAKDKKKK